MNKTSNTLFTPVMIYIALKLSENVRNDICLFLSLSPRFYIALLVVLVFNIKARSQITKIKILLVKLQEELTSGYAILY